MIRSVLRWLIPRDESSSRDNEILFDLFERQADIAYEPVAILQEMIMAMHVDPLWHRRMRDIEHRADSVTSRIIKEAEGRFSTPFDTEDIYALAVAVDDVVDAIDDVVQRVVLYRMIPDETLKKFFSLLCDGVSNVREGMQALRHLKNQDECHKKTTDCEHAADALIDSLIADSCTLRVNDILGQGECEVITGITRAELQLVLDTDLYNCRHWEIIQCTEAAIDFCRTVFHKRGNIYLKAN